MGKGLWSSDWVTQVAIAAGYALTFLVLHSFIAAHWHLYAGFQLICLLMFPYRYWGALLVGEAIPNAYEAYLCLADLGATWVAVRTLPEILLSMPVVWLCRSKLNVFPSKHLVNIKSLLLCVLFVALVLSTYSYILVSVARVTADAPPVTPVMAAGYFVGNYAGLLTLVPWALIARLEYRKGRIKAQLKRMASSPMLPDALGIAVPVIALMAWAAKNASATQVPLLEMAMFIPAAWLTVKHGWRAAAFGGTMVIVCNALLHADTPDLGLIEIQMALCVAITGLYALGATITAQKISDEREQFAARNVRQVAIQTLQMSERKMKVAAERLEFVAGSLHITNGRLLEHMKRIVPNVESHSFYKQAVAAHAQVYKLAESLHPSAWRDRGLPAALNDTIARALDEAGIAYSCEIGGRGFSFLEASVLTALYRTACEAIVYVASNLTCSRIKLRVRAGETNNHRWVVVRVDSHLDENEVANAVYFTEHRRDLGVKLGANAVNVEEMRAHARVFDGNVHVRSWSDRVTITALLHGRVKEVQKRKASAPLRLWVN
jgi:two-component system, NarL family, sensor histidine kinase FusK